MKYQVRTNMDNTFIEAHNFLVEGDMIVFRDIKHVAVAAVKARDVRDIIAMNALVSRP